MSNITSDENEVPHVELEVLDSAFNQRIREFKTLNHGYKNVEEFLLSAFEVYRLQLSSAVAEFDLIKSVSYFNREFERSFLVDDESDVLTEKRDIHIPTSLTM